jgi:hypothetical protein
LDTKEKKAPSEKIGEKPEAARGLEDMMIAEEEMTEEEVIIEEIGTIGKTVKMSKGTEAETIGEIKKDSQIRRIGNMKEETDLKEEGENMIKSENSTPKNTMMIGTKEESTKKVNYFAIQSTDKNREAHQRPEEEVITIVLPTEAIKKTGVPIKPKQRKRDTNPSMKIRR